MAMLQAVIASPPAVAGRPVAVRPPGSSDIPPENAVHMLAGICTGIGIPPVAVSVKRDAGAQPKPEYLPGEPPAKTLDRVWDARARLPGLCLEYAAYAAAKMGQEDRAMRFFAVGNVREAYDRLRCLPPKENGYSLYADTHGIVQMMLGMDADVLHRRSAEVLPLAKAAAADPATYDYPIDLAKVCDLSAPTPATEWPALRAKIADSLAKTEPPPAPPPALSPPSPPPGGARR